MGNVLSKAEFILTYSKGNLKKTLKQYKSNPAIRKECQKWVFLKNQVSTDCLYELSGDKTDQRLAEIC